MYPFPPLYATPTGVFPTGIVATTLVPESTLTSFELTFVA